MKSIVIRELITKLGFDSTNAEKKLKKFNAGVNGAIKGLTATVGAATAAGGALFALSKNVAAGADDIAKNARSLGIGVESYQEYAYAASLAGIEQDLFNDALKQINIRALEAKEGSQQVIDLFNKLGVEAFNANGQLKSTEEILESSIKGFSKMESGVDRTALTLRLFGESGARMAPFLSQGTKAINAQREEAHRLNKVLDETQTAQAEAFNDEVFSRLGGAIKAIKDQIGISLLPIFTQLAKQAREFIEANREIITERLSTAVLRTGRAVSWLAQNTDKVYTIFKFLIGLKVAGWLLKIGVALKALGIGALLVTPIGQAIAIAGTLAAAMYALRKPIAQVGIWVQESFKKAGEAIEAVIEKLEKFNKYNPLYQLGRGLGNVANKISDLRKEEMTVSGLPGTQSILNKYNNSNPVNMNSNITVNVPSGTGPEMSKDISMQVQRIIRGEFDRTFRHTANQIPAAQ